MRSLSSFGFTTLRSWKACATLLLYKSVQVSSFFSSSSSMSFLTERADNGVITVSPRNEAQQSGLVVICHGLGDSAEGFVDVAEVSTEMKLVYKIFTVHLYTKTHVYNEWSFQ